MKNARNALFVHSMTCLAGLLCLAMIAGCGGKSSSASVTTPMPAPSPTPTPTPPPAAPPAFLFTGNSADRTASSFQINASTGALTPVSGSPFSTGPVNDSDTLATDPQGRFLYVPGNTTLNCGNLCSGGITEFTIDPSTGALGAVQGSPVITGSGFRGSQVDPSGKFLYTVDINLNQVYGFSIGANGALTPVPGSPFATGSATSEGIAIHGSGQFLYVANSEGNSVSAFQINSAGSLSPVAGSPFSAGSAESCPPGRGVIGCGSSVAVTGNFLYFVNGVTASNQDQENSNVVGFTINPSTGALSPMPGSPFANPGSVAQRLLATPNGSFLYVVNTGSNNVAGTALILPLECSRPSPARFLAPARIRWEFPPILRALSYM